MFAPLFIWTTRLQQAKGITQPKSETLLRQETPKEIPLPKRDPLAPEDSIRRLQMEKEVRNAVIKHRCLGRHLNDSVRSEGPILLVSTIIQEVKE
jgi:hypothetical protein